MAYIGSQPANSVLTSDQIADGVITTNDLANNIVTVDKLAPSAQNLTWRNRIINGAMRIDQRNNGASVTVNTNGGAYNYASDRFFNYNNTGVAYTIQRSTVAPSGFNNSALLTFSSTIVPAAGTEANYSQWIEGFNIADLGFGTANAQPVTLSFWVRSSVSGTFGIGFGNGSGTRTYGTTYAVSAANTWEFKAITIPGDTSGTWAADNTQGLFVRFHVAAGSNFVVSSNNAWGTRSGAYGSADSIFGSAPSGIGSFANAGATFYITGVQLEAGSVATPFERVDYSEMLRRCQRYYFKKTVAVEGGGISAATAAFDSIAGIQQFFPSEMRAVPTLTLLGTTARSGGTTNDQRISTTHFVWGNKQTGSGTASVWAYATGGFEVTAEL